MFRSRERQTRAVPYPFVPGTTYLSVLIENLKLGDTYRRLQLVVNNGILSEEELIKRRRKLGYGSRFNSARQSRSHAVSREGQRSRSVASSKPRPHHRPRSTLSALDTRFLQTPQYQLSDSDLHVSKSVPPAGYVDQQAIDRLVIDGTLDEIYLQKKNLLTRCEPLWFPNSESHSTDDMLSAHDLPGGGLRRETTSFGVYSNLAAHRRRETTKTDEARRLEPLTVVTSGLQYKLIQAIKQADIEQVQQIFQDYPDLKLHFLDENDRTVLHHCVDLQKRRVKSDILKLLLEKNPSSIIDYCKIEAPVLYNAAKLGHAYSVYILLRHGANVNIQFKRTLRTALHEAVVNGHSVVAEILLYYGASTKIRDKDGRFAWDLCKDSVFPREAFDAIEESVTSKRTEIQELSSKSTVTNFNHVGVTAEITSQVESDLPLLVRRETIETSSASFTLTEEEDLASDVFTCRLFQQCNGAKIMLSLPLFDKSFSSREEILAKTGSGHVISPKDMRTGKDGLVVVFDTVLEGEESFVCVCRPKVEYWQVGKEQTVLESVIDEQVRIHINKNTFNTGASLTLQVIELPEDATIREGWILSSTPYYKIDANQTARAVTIELPKPSSFDGDGQCVIMAKHDEKWNVVEVKSDSKQNTVTFTENHLPVIATVAVVNCLNDSLTREANETFKLVSDIKFRVSFICFAKRVTQSRKFTVVIECCEYKALEPRRRFWKGQDYQEQSQKDGLAHIDVPSKRTFKLVFYESAILRKDPKFIDLEFHRKRDNIVHFNVELKGKSIQCINGRLYVYEAQDWNYKQGELTSKEHISSIDINLVLNHIEIGQNGSIDGSSTRTDNTTNVKSLSISSQSGERPVSRAARRSARGSRNGTDLQVKRQEPEPQMDALKKVQDSLARAMRNVDPIEIEESTPSEALSLPEPVILEEDGTVLPEIFTAEFLDDTLLDLVIDESADDWYKILVLAGLPFVEIEEAVLQCKNMILVKKQLFRNWRDRQEYREDVGLPLLLGALFKGGCRNVATTVQIKLRNWYEQWKGDDENEFQKWVGKAYQDSDLLVPSDYPKPMTDPFLVLMSDELPLTRDLARALMIADSASDEVLDNPSYVLDGMKVMKLLTMFRDRTERGIDALEKLISALEDLGLEKLRTYALMCAKAWVKRTATRKDDPFRYQVGTLMNKLQ